MNPSFSMKWFLFWFVLTSFCLVVLIVILVSWVTRLYFTSLWNLRDTRAATGAFDDGFMCILFFYCIPACWLGFWSYSRYYHIIIFLIIVMGRICVLTNLYVMYWTIEIFSKEQILSTLWRKLLWNFAGCSSWVTPI